MDPQHGLLVMGTLGGGLVTLLATVDGGVSWQPVAAFASPMPGALLWSAKVFEHGGHLLAVPLRVTGAVVGPGGTGVQLLGNAFFHPTVSMSDDAGRTWSSLRAGPPVNAAFNSVVGVALDDQGSACHVRPWPPVGVPGQRMTWRARSAPLPRGMETAGTIIAAPGALFVAARDGGLAPSNELLRSRDGGNHWSVVPLPKLAG